MDHEIYVSTDIEADGKVPGLSSMLSFASAAFNINKRLIGTFSRNLELLDGAIPDAGTASFWRENQAAYEATRVGTVHPSVAMHEYKRWLDDLGAKYYFVGYPAVYDFKWIDWYFIKFLGENPYGFSNAIDVKTFAWAILRGQFNHASKRNFPSRWFDDLPHTHVALQDAIEQGAMFINVLREHNNLPPIKNILGLQKGIF
jgi:hypothetical protein